MTRYRGTLKHNLGQEIPHWKVWFVYWRQMRLSDLWQMRIEQINLICVYLVVSVITITLQSTTIEESLEITHVYHGMLISGIGWQYKCGFPVEIFLKYYIDRVPPFIWLYSPFHEADCSCQHPPLAHLVIYGSKMISPCSLVKLIHLRINENFAFSQGEDFYSRTCSLLSAMELLMSAIQIVWVVTAFWVRNQ